MKRITMMWGIAAGFAVVVIMVVVVSALHPAPPFFSVRVIHFDRGDVNALVEITNLTESSISFEYIAPGFKGRTDSINPHEATGTTVPAPTEKGRPFKVTFWVTESSDKSWRVRYAPMLKRFGIKLRPGSKFSFEVTKPTGWMDS